MKRKTFPNNDACDLNNNAAAGLLPAESLSAADLMAGTSTSSCDLSTLSWSAAAILLLFFCLAHLGVLLCFSLGISVSPFVAPAALLVSLAVGDWLARREGLRGRLRIAPPAIALGVMAVSLILAAAFFDMSWDGLWYHQTAVYQMAHGWNPLKDPLHPFTPHLQDWLHFYAKGPWYVALAIFQITHNIEWAKAAPWAALAAMFLAVFAVLIDFGMRRRTAAVIAAIVSLNPVVTCELASYYVDGLMISFLACFVAAMSRWFRRPSLLMLLIAIASAILCINAKLNGLAYLCFFSAAGGLYVLIKQRDLLLRYAAIQIASVLLGVALFGFNPYVTNYMYRGHPFYPILGTAAYPSLSQRGQDPIELYETPKNMMGRDRYVRFFYSIFGRPIRFTNPNSENAILMWPFDVSWKDFSIFYFHEERISGFGPLFSGALILCLLLLVAALIRPGIPRLVIVLFTGAILLSLMVSIHTWWARYGPQLWWLPIIAVVAGLAIPGWRVVRWAAWSLAAILLVNAVLVGVGHFLWEIEATRTTYEQMAFLRQKGDVEIDFQYFYEPFSERLRAAGITFHATHRLRGANPMELMSVAPGYPGAVRACFQEK